MAGLPSDRCIREVRHEVSYGDADKVFKGILNAEKFRLVGKKLTLASQAELFDAHHILRFFSDSQI